MLARLHQLAIDFSFFLWEALEFDDFWCDRLGRSREGNEWLPVLKALAMYRLIDPGSEWRLHRQRNQRSAMADLLRAGGTQYPVPLPGQAAGA